MHDSNRATIPADFGVEPSDAAETLVRIVAAPRTPSGRWKMIGPVGRAQLVNGVVLGAADYERGDLRVTTSLERDGGWVVYHLKVRLKPRRRAPWLKRRPPTRSELSLVLAAFGLSWREIEITTDAERDNVRHVRRPDIGATAALMGIPTDAAHAMIQRMEQDALFKRMLARVRGSR